MWCGCGGGAVDWICFDGGYEAEGALGPVLFFCILLVVLLLLLFIPHCYAYSLPLFIQFYAITLPITILPPHLYLCCCIIQLLILLWIFSIPMPSSVVLLLPYPIILIPILPALFLLFPCLACCVCILRLLPVLLPLWIPHPIPSQFYLHLMPIIITPYLPYIIHVCVVYIVGCLLRFVRYCVLLLPSPYHYYCFVVTFVVCSHLFITFLLQNMPLDTPPPPHRYLDCACTYPSYY